MDTFFAGPEYRGQPFQLFGLAHLIALGIVFLANLSLAVWGRRLTPRGRLVFRSCLAVILIIDELGWHYWNWKIGQWTVQTMLPLHLCSALVFLSAFMLLTKSYSIYEFAYFLGIAGASQALLTPDAGIYGFPHFRFFQVIISHGSIVLAAVYMTAVEGFRPTPRSILRVLTGTNVYLLVVAGINWVLGSNYLFIMHKPVTASLIDVLGPWPWYILSMEALGMAMCLLLYLPFAVHDLQRRVNPGQA